MPDVLEVADLPEAEIEALCNRFGVTVNRVRDGGKIRGSFWGAPEAGIVGNQIYVRGDTPVHSLLHELGHIVCMSPERRSRLDTDARSDDSEEAAVCYLQILIAGSTSAIGRERIEQDMDSWGYSFPEGNTRCWFEAATDSRDWLIRHGVLSPDGEIIPPQP